MKADPTLCTRLPSQPPALLLKFRQIGRLGYGSIWPNFCSKQKVVEEEKLIALNTRQKLAVPLLEKEVLSHDSRRFRFELPTKDHKLGLPIGKHFFVSGRWNGEFVMRPYTPVTGDEVSGYVDLVIKVRERRGWDGGKRGGGRGGWEGYK